MKFKFPPLWLETSNAAIVVTASAGLTGAAFARIATMASGIKAIGWLALLPLIVTIGVFQYHAASDNWLRI